MTEKEDGNLKKQIGTGKVITEGRLKGKSKSRN